MNETGPIFDRDQRQAIAVDANTVVSAGAGSGKTAVLAERYARLVLDRGLDVSGILCLTFTRKAAAEMQARIHGRLAADPRPRAAEQLARFDKARIATIDSFCVALVGGAGQRYGIPPNFAVDDRRLTLLADRTALDLIMEQRREPALRRLVAVLGFDRVRTALLVDLALRHINLIRPPTFSADVQRQTVYARRRCEDDYRKLREAAAAIAVIDPTGSETAKTARAYIDGIEFPALDGNSTSYQAIALIALRLSGEAPPMPWRLPTGNAKQPALAELRELTIDLRRTASSLAAYAATLSLGDDRIAIATLLDEFAERFLERKRSEGLLSFHDTTEAAVDILKKDIELRSFYKRRFQAIMIDEFQDDNELQKNLLYLLAERNDRASLEIPEPADLKPDALFFVGDEKQSIYRFRGADVTVFRALADELAASTAAMPTAAAATTAAATTAAATTAAATAAAAVAAYNLTFNYRSSPALIAFFNAFFPGVFPQSPNDDDNPPWEARFSPMSVPPPNEAADTSAPAVEFYILDKGERDGDDDDEETDAPTAEATAAAERLAEGIARDEFRYDEVAVLFRSTSRQATYERVFRRFGIPFVAADPRGVFAEGPANDFYAVARLILYPGDRNAYAAVLRSPLTGIGDDAFVRIMLTPTNAPFAEPADPTWFADDSDARRFARGRAVYAALKQAARSAGIAELLALFWFDEGYRSALLANRDAAVCLEHYELLRDLALDADRRRLSLSGFLDELGPLMGSAEKIELGEPPKRTGAVRFMTIHKSKGLEFPVTVIADAGNKGREAANSEPYYIDPEFGVSVNLKAEDAAKTDVCRNIFFDRAREREAALDRAELRRLLYVAATRAERRLLVFASRSPDKTMAAALDGLSPSERSRALLAFIRKDKDGRPIVRSFTDLIAAGLAAFDPSDARIKIAAIPFRSDSDCRRLAAERRSAMEGRSAGDAAVRMDDPEDFFAYPAPPPILGRIRSVNASALAEAASNATFSSAGAFDDEGTEAEAARADINLADIDPILNKTKLEKEFGTLCHLAVETALTGLPVETPKDLAARLVEADSSERALMETAAHRLAAGFLASDLGQAAAAAVRRRTEFPFILALADIGGAFVQIRGAMDLIFESGGRCIIVDFKTDRAMRPDQHRLQLAAYRAAASAYSDLPAETWLFYLRHGIGVISDDRTTPAELKAAVDTAANAAEFSAAAANAAAANAAAANAAAANAATIPV